MTTKLITDELYPLLASDPNDDISLTITAHRGGGGSFGTSGVTICDTMSQEIRGEHRPVTREESEVLHESARTIARILVAIRN